MRTETSDFEHAYYIGGYMSAILYGLELTIYVVILHYLLSKNGQFLLRNRKFWVIYSTLMIILSTISVACNAIWGEQMWITLRSDPGGVAKFLETQITVWYETLASTAVIGCFFMGDALLIYRLFLVYRRSYAVIALPALAYIIAFALAIVQVVLAGLPHGNFFAGQAVKIAIPYYVITVCLNIGLTALICGRIMRVSKCVSSTIGEENAKIYTSVTAILVESAALYSAAGIMFLVPYALESPMTELFGQLWTKMSVICPLMIILRVVRGRAWTEDIITRTTLTFAASGAGVGSATFANSVDQSSHFRLEELESPTNMA